LAGCFVAEQTGIGAFQFVGLPVGFAIGCYGPLGWLRNRTRRIASLSDPVRQDEGYRRLREFIGLGLALPLHRREVAVLCHEVERLGQAAAWVAATPEATWFVAPLRLIWDLLTTAPANPHVRELAHRFLADPAAPGCRDLAFCYLWRRFPADAEAAFQR